MRKYEKQLPARFVALHSLNLITTMGLFAKKTSRIISKNKFRDWHYATDTFKIF